MPKRDTEKERELRAWIEVEFFEKIDRIKENLGVKNTTELLRILINEKYKELFEKSQFDLMIEQILGSLKDKKKLANIKEVVKLLINDSDSER